MQNSNDSHGGSIEAGFNTLLNFLRISKRIVVAYLKACFKLSVSSVETLNPLICVEIDALFVTLPLNNGHSNTLNGMAK